MTAAEVLRRLEEAGCQVRLDGDTIKVHGRLTPDLRQAIRGHKPELVALLKEQVDLDCQAREIGRVFRERGWVVFESKLLSGEVVVFVKDAKVAIPTRWKDAVTYTLAELEALTAHPLPDREGLKAIHGAKKLFGGRVVAEEVIKNGGD